jgi:ParB/RepB/Spo0J family partition protein
MKRPRSEVPAQVIEIDDIGVEESSGVKKEISKKDISELAKDMTDKKGLLYPIIVCVDPDANSREPTYKIKNGWGRKRLEAAHQLGWKSIAAVVIPPVNGVLEPDLLVQKLATLIEQIQTDAVSDYDIGKIVSDIEKQHGFKRSEVARVVGLSLGYMYNLVRWYRNVPPEIKDAWKEDHAYMNQSVLDAMSHMKPNEAILHWKKVVAMRSSPTPYSPTGKKANGEANGVNRKPHKATETQMINVLKAFAESPLRDPIRKLCSDAVKFCLGTLKDIPGITDYRKLDPYLLDKGRVDKQQKSV